MTMPGFTAEASLGEVKDSYALALGHAQESGIVLPQHICLCCGPDWCEYCPCKIRTHVLV